MMKKRTVLGVFGLLLMLAGCGAEAKPEISEKQTEEETVQTQEKQQEATMQEEALQQKTEVKIEVEHYEGASDENDPTVSYVYEYDMPDVVISGKEEAQDKIQADIEAYVNRFLESLTQNEFGMVYDGMPQTENFQNLSVHIMRADDSVISLMMKTEGYAGGAHGWVTLHYLNYFTETGEKITFDKLGTGFRQKAQELITEKAEQLQQEEAPFFENYKDMIPLVVLDGTENRNEIYAQIYPDMEWNDTEWEPMSPTFYITDTGFGFSSGQYVLQPYAAGIIDFVFTATDFGDACTIDIFENVS